MSRAFPMSSTISDVFRHPFWQPMSNVAAESSTMFRHGWRKDRHPFWPRTMLCTYVAACELATSADRKSDEQLLSETPSRSKALAQRVKRTFAETDVREFDMFKQKHVSTCCSKTTTVHEPLQRVLALLVTSVYNSFGSSSVMCHCWLGKQMFSLPK
jgi:hypothetical protein